MASLHYSRLAEADLSDIAQYTLGKWGAEQATRYLNDLEDSCVMLADNPSLGRQCNDLRAGLRSIECGSHLVFYRLSQTEIHISRILHQRMIPGAQLFSNDEIEAWE